MNKLVAVLLNLVLGCSFVFVFGFKLFELGIELAVVVSQEGVISFKGGESFLGVLQFSVKLPLDLVKISLSLLFTGQSIFGFFNLLFKLSLGLSKVVSFVFHCLQVIQSSGIGLFKTLLFILEGGNGSVSCFEIGGKSFDFEVKSLLVLFELGNVFISSGQLIGEVSSITFEFLVVGLKFVVLSFQLFEVFVGIGEVRIELSLQLGHFFKLFSSITTVVFHGTKLQGELVLFLGKFGNLFFSFLQHTGILFHLGHLFEHLSFLLLSCFFFFLVSQQRLDAGEKFPPTPIAEAQELSDVVLDASGSTYSGQHSEEFNSHELSSGSGLNLGDDDGKEFITLFFKIGKGASLEEDLGLTDSVQWFWKFNGLQDDFRSSLAVNDVSALRSSEKLVTLVEVWVLASVGETLSANTDTFKYTITSELMQDQFWKDSSWSLDFVGDNATDKGWLGTTEGAHQSVQLLSVEGADSLHGTTLLLLLLATRWCFWFNCWEENTDQVPLGFLEKFDNRGVKRILVFVEPSVKVVSYISSVMLADEVSNSLFANLWLDECWVLLFVSIVQFLFEGFISSLGDNRLFLKSCEDTTGLFEKIDASLQVHTEVHHFPFNTFTHVFFLFKNEHVVVEELLQFFVGEVNAKLFEGVEIENFETSNIQDTTEEASWEISIKSSVTHLDKPLEELVEDSLGNSTGSRSTLFYVLTLGDHLSTDLDTWSGESL